MNIQSFLLVLTFLGTVVMSCTTKTETVWLDELPIKTFSEGVPAVVGIGPGTDSVVIANERLTRGISLKTTSLLTFQLDGKARSFTAKPGMDKNCKTYLNATFYVIGDKKILYQSAPMTRGTRAEEITVDLKGVKRLGLLVTDKQVHGNLLTGFWGEARFEMEPATRPVPLPKVGTPYILTPKPAETPRINSPRVVGATPGNPLLYTVATSGKRPMTFAAVGLPAGLTLDPETGIITGRVAARGDYKVTLSATNDLGQATKELMIKIGDKIALTPPIGWNGWNSWARLLDREKVIASADAMVKMGLRDHGWSYINIDDTWQGHRSGPTKALQPNEKFPRMKEMVDYIHSLGLKAGLYSTPWITSYAGYGGASTDGEDGAFPDSVRLNKNLYRYVGKYTFEESDAKQMAEWGFDYLKYDWRITLRSAKSMGEALRSSGRDILYSLSNSAFFPLADQWAKIANAWRTGPDIRDSWLSLYVSGFIVDKWGPYSGPGHWNDQDMLVVGNVTTGQPMHPTRLTPDEQYAHVSLFALQAAPLLIGCPIEQLDDFTLNLLTNDEVIEINQDPLGLAARLKLKEQGVQTWVKPMEDGSVAIGMFHVGNFAETPQSYIRWDDEPAADYTLELSKIGLNGQWSVRDVWRQQDLGDCNGKFSTHIPHHGVTLLRLTPQ